MNDDLVVQKISKLLENNTAFIGYALNGGIGTKINVRNTETGKTIQAFSINVDSSGEVLVVKDSSDGQYKAVTFKTEEKVSERIIQLRKTKPIDDKKTIEYTDSDIEIFYLFVKLINMGSPVPSQLTSTWIRKGNSCTQFVGAYERCNYASNKTIGGVSYKGLPYTPYTSLENCLNDDTSPDAKSPNGTKDENGFNGTWKVYHTLVDSEQEARILAALTSHDNYYGTSYKNLFGYGSIIECSGAMYLKGWGLAQDNAGVSFQKCFFGYIPEYMTGCSTIRQNLGHCTTRGFINSKAPMYQQDDGYVNYIDNSFSYQNGWDLLPYDFMYSRNFFTSEYQNSGGLFVILDVNEDQNPPLPSGWERFIPYCPSGGQGGPYNGTGGNRIPPQLPPLVEKRNMKLSTHKAEIWLGSNKKENAIKLYELGASDLFSGSYNAFITRANETQVDIINRRNLSQTLITPDYSLQHESYYLNRDKNIIDLRIDPRVWVYILNNEPKAGNQGSYHYITDPQNKSLQILIDNLYNRTLNLTVLDKNNLIIHLKLGLKPSSSLSNTDCKGKIDPFGVYNPDSDFPCGQSWEYQKCVTIKIKDWEINSTLNNLDVSNLGEGVWNKSYIERKFLTSFSYFSRKTDAYFSRPYTKEGSREVASNIILGVNNSTSLDKLIAGSNFEQYNYSINNLPANTDGINFPFYNNSIYIQDKLISTNFFRKVGRSTYSWWALWDKTQYSSKTKRLSSITGYTQNASQLFRGFKLDLNLDHSDRYNQSYTFAMGFETYFEYFPSRPLVMIPSNIKSVRDKKINFYEKLLTRESVLNSYGLNFYFSVKQTGWAELDTFSRKDGLAVPLFQPFPPQYSSGYTNETRENDLDWRYGNTSTDVISPVLNTRRWFNNLWAQFIFMGDITIDVDSYKQVKYTLPTNPAQYINHSASFSSKNVDYPFSLQNPTTTPIPLQSVLSPGILDVTKQVKITKPTNVEIDPNMSFLVYMIPFCTVTKKTKEI